MDARTYSILLMFIYMYNYRYPLDYLLLHCSDFVPSLFLVHARPLIGQCFEMACFASPCTHALVRPYREIACSTRTFLVPPSSQAQAAGVTWGGERNAYVLEK